MSEIANVFDDYDEGVRKTLNLIRDENTDGAIAIIDRLFAIDDQRAEASYLLGLTSLVMGEKGRALEFMEKATSLDPECFEYAEALANLYTQLGRLSEGLFFAKLSTTLMPHPTIDGLIPIEFSNYFESLASAMPSSHYLAGIQDFQGRKFKDCLKHFDREIRINPDNEECHRDMGYAYSQLGDFTAALRHLIKATEIKPDDPITRFNLGNLCYNIGEFEEAVLQHKSALHHDQDSVELAAAIYAKSSMLPAPHSGATDEFRKQLNKRLLDAPGLPPEVTVDETEHDDRESEKKIKIGYLSNRVMFGDEGRLLDILTQFHDRRLFEVILYKQSTGSDSTTQRLRASADEVRDSANLDDELMAVVINGDEIDLLVDLCTDDLNNRATLLNMHPAKIQIGGWGGRMGVDMPGIDVVVVDEAIQKSVETNLGTKQESCLLDYGMYSFEPRDILPDISALPAKTNKFPSIGLTCNTGAITSNGLAALDLILDRLPEAKIVFGATPLIDNESAQRINTLFRERNLLDRVIISNHQKYAEQNIVDPDYWQSIDVFLDLGGGASPDTVSDALWMGVPVLCLRDPKPWTQLGVSVVYTAAFVDWIQDEVETYSDKVVGTLSDLDSLEIIRRDMRSNLQRTLLFHPEPYVRSIERAYYKILGRELPTV